MPNASSSSEDLLAMQQDMQQRSDGLSVQVPMNRWPSIEAISVNVPEQAEDQQQRRQELRKAGAAYLDKAISQASKGADPFQQQKPRRQRQERVDPEFMAFGKLLRDNLVYVYVAGFIVCQASSYVLISVRPMHTHCTQATVLVASELLQLYTCPQRRFAQKLNHTKVVTTPLPYTPLLTCTIGFVCLCAVVIQVHADASCPHLPAHAGSGSSRSTCMQNRDGRGSAAAQPVLAQRRQRAHSPVLLSGGHQRHSALRSNRYMLQRSRLSRRWGSCLV